MKPSHLAIALAMIFSSVSSVLAQAVFSVASNPTSVAYAFDTAAPVGTVYLIQMTGVSAGGSMRVSYGVPITSAFSDIRVAGTGDYAGRVEIDTAASNRSAGLLVATMPSDTGEGQISVSGVKVSLLGTVRTSLAASVSTNAGAMLNGATLVLVIDAILEQYPRPSISSISPTSVRVGDTVSSMTVNGSNFLRQSVICWDGASRATSFQSSSQLSTAVTATEIANGRVVAVTVSNPSPGGGTSNEVTFTVNNPAPHLTSISPSRVTAGSAGFTLSVTGSSFARGATVLWDGQGMSTTYVNSGTLQASVSPEDVAFPGTPKVSVFNPGPGGGTSAVNTITIDTTGTLYFAHVVVGGGYTTVINLTNTGSDVAEGPLSLFDHSGNALLASINGAGLAGPSAGHTAAVSAPASVFPVSVSSGGTAYLKMQPASLPEVAKSGWAMVGTSAGLLSGVSTLELVDNGNVTAVAGILASPPVAAATIPVDNDGSLSKYTGFALANINKSGISVRIVILDADGRMTQTIRPDELNPLGARKQVARFMHEYVSSLLDFKGSIVLVADGGMSFVATALLQKQGRYTALPVIPGKPASLPE